LIAELADNACWETLIVLAQELGQEEMVGRFQRALADEADHLIRVQTWLRRGILAALKGSELRGNLEENPASA
jgi:hypothetical protein